MTDPTSPTDPNVNQLSSDPSVASGVLGVVESLGGALMPSDEKLNDLLEAGKAFVLHEVDHWLESGIGFLRGWYRRTFHRG